MKPFFVLIVASSAAQAQEFISTDTPLSDADFYRLVSCAAPPGRPCQKDVVRWSPADARDVSVGIVQIENGYPKGVAKLLAAALLDSIEQINAVNANIHLTLSEGVRKPDIGVHLLTIAEGDLIRNTGLDPLDGATLAAAKTQLWWRMDHSLINGAIVFGTDIQPIDLASVMLEEVTQAMGLLTDIGGTYYQPLSIFSDSSNQLTALAPQDIMALRRHYPKSP